MKFVAGFSLVTAWLVALWDGWTILPRHKGTGWRHHWMILYMKQIGNVEEPR